jgi:hypothetical protein
MQAPTCLALLPCCRLTTKTLDLKKSLHDDRSLHQLPQSILPLEMMTAPPQCCQNHGSPPPPHNGRMTKKTNNLMMGSSINHLVEEPPCPSPPKRKMQAWKPHKRSYTIRKRILRALKNQRSVHIQRMHAPELANPIVDAFR